MTIDDLKRALVEVQNLCVTHFGKQDTCDGCPCRIVRGDSWYGCRLKSPDSWDIDDWKEDANENSLHG